MLTREHIPPASAGNTGEVRHFDFEDWLSRANPEALAIGEGERGQGGISGFTLCADCNSKTGAWYGAEYGHWVAMAGYLLSQLPSVDGPDGEVEPFGVSFASPQPMRPGAFIRQALSCFMLLGVVPHELSSQGHCLANRRERVLG